MKTTVIFLLCMIISYLTFGQEMKQSPNKINEVQMSPPKFLGAEEFFAVLNETQFGSLNDYLVKNIRFPESSEKSHIEGTEVIQFVVTPKGEVTDFKIINSLSPEIDWEVIRVLNTTNRLWKPALNNGIPVAIEKEVSIKFITADEINYPANFDKMAKLFFNKGNKQLFVKGNHKSALRHYNRAICYLPNDKALLVIRGMCRYELGDKTGACQDWNRTKALGGLDSDFYLNNFCEFKGYSDMISTLNEKK